MNHSVTNDDQRQPTVPSISSAMARLPSCCTCDHSHVAGSLRSHGTFLGTGGAMGEAGPTGPGTVGITMFFSWELMENHGITMVWR